METYICTFGIGHTFGDRFQPIIAQDIEQARIKMLDTFGDKWAGIYTKSEFEQLKAAGRFKTLKPFEPIYAKEAI